MQDEGDGVLPCHALCLFLLDVVDELAGQLDILFIHLDTVVYLIEVEILAEGDEANLLSGEFHANLCLLLSEFGELDACNICYPTNDEVFITKQPMVGLQGSAYMLERLWNCFIRRKKNKV